MNTQNDFYRAAIDVLMLEDLDYKAIVVVLAKHDPAMFLKVHQEVRDYKPWLAEVDAAIHSHKKIEAIKLWRHYTGLGLKDAKDAVERRYDELGLDW